MGDIWTQGKYIKIYIMKWGVGDEPKNEKQNIQSKLIYVSKTQPPHRK